MTARPGEQPTDWLNVLRFVFANPSRLRVLAHKIAKRVRGENDSGSAENEKWLKANSISAEEIALSHDAALWDEARSFEAAFKAHANQILSGIPHELGGGGDYRFLYWLTRYLRPKVVLETGVAAGWSSRAFLMALRKNGGGRLYSSDFPYFRLPDPDHLVGILVEPELRSDWVLELEGDAKNLPRILKQASSVDIFHYDSDKMRSGRAFAMDLVREKMAPDGIIVMDDIHNDDWFKTYVTEHDLPFAIVEGRYGIIGSLGRRQSDRSL